MDEESKERREAKITGVINIGNSGINVEAYKADIIKEHEFPDEYGKSKRVDFEETKTDDGEHYVNYWVY